MEIERHLYEWTLTGRGEIPLSSEAMADLAAHGRADEELRRLVWFGIRTLVDANDSPPSDAALIWREIIE